MKTIKSHQKIIIILVIMLIGLGIFLFVKNKATGSNNLDGRGLSQGGQEIPESITERTEKIKIESGSTFGKLLNDNGISASLSNELYKVALPQNDNNAYWATRRDGLMDQRTSMFQMYIR